MQLCWDIHLFAASQPRTSFIRRLFCLQPGTFLQVHLQPTCCSSCIYFCRFSLNRSRDIKDFISLPAGEFLSIPIATLPAQCPGRLFTFYPFPPRRWSLGTLIPFPPPFAFLLPLLPPRLSVHHNIIHLSNRYISSKSTSIPLSSWRSHPQ